MSAPPALAGEIVTDRRQLVEYLESGCKPESAWRIGTEHEKFVFHLSDNSPAAYDDNGSGIHDILQGMTRFGWQPVLECGRPIALTKGACNITLEPGGQFELSGAPLDNLHQTCDEVHTHLAEVKEISAELGLGMIGVGFQPKWPRAAIPWMPKGRYKIMGEYMPKRGSLGLDMMLRTCTVQVNLDFDSEADMVQKFQVGLALQPVAVALFANSPFVEGRPSGYLSYRSHVWEDTDPDRCGVLPFVMEPGMGFERYVDYVLDVPMYFVYRDGRYIDASGQSFHDFMAGRLPALPGAVPTTSDWADHLSTVFPEVRLKRFLEMRGADGGPWSRICAVPALWTGILYDRGALAAAAALVREWTPEDHDLLRREVPRSALNTPFRGGTVGDVAAAMVAIAREGLRARGRLDRAGNDETGFLETLAEIVRSRRTPADVLLDKYANDWHGDIDCLFREEAY